jgi:hypothetical protein
MSTEQRFETKRIDHLGIVAGICNEIELMETIDRVVGRSERKVSCGQAVQAMVLNALGFTSRALYLMPQYLDNKPVDLLISPDLDAADFNDDSLGRSLEQLFEAGVTEVFAEAARHAPTVYGIEHRFHHLDSSSFHLHGQYANDEPEVEAIEITYGYSRDHRPDLKQVVVNLITGHRSQLPVWMEALSGNQSDKDSFPDSIQAFCQQLKSGKGCFFVVDSALYGAANLHSLGEIRWLTRVPETLAEAKALLAEIEPNQMTAFPDGSAFLEVPSTYAGIAQREEKTLHRRVEKEAKAAQKAWRKLTAQTFNCQEDALTASKDLEKRWKYHQAEAAASPLTRYPSPGRPADGATPDVIGYQLQGQVVLSENALAAARRRLGRFILATNETDPDLLSPQAIADVGMYGFRRQLAYKGQWYGGEMFLADRFFPSTKRCSGCGQFKEMGLGEREYVCPACGQVMDRDLNAAAFMRINLEQLFYC